MTTTASADPTNTIAFMGVPGTHSDLACRKAYPYMHTIACPSFEEVFDAVEEGRAKLGMIPIENTLAGRVAEIHNLLPKTKLFIVGEHFQKVEHHLYGVEGSSLETLKEVYSHHQALMQCREHLRELKLSPHTYGSTAAAGEFVAKEKDVTKGAICSALAGELYGLKLLKPNVHDSQDNMTVFIVISKEPADVDYDRERVITTVLFTIRNIPAALYKALGGFATNGVNIIKLESYIPGGVSTMAQFFLSFEGHPRQKNVQLAIEELGFFCQNVKVLGVYPGEAKRFGK
jgi:prephenate dehydratase